VAGALDLLRRGACRQAARLWVVPKGRWQKIVRVEFNDEIPGELDMIPEPAATGGNENDDDWVPF
jgi:hypothetical protein